MWSPFRSVHWPASSPAAPRTVTLSHSRNFFPMPAAVTLHPSSTTADQLPDAALYTSSVLSLLHGRASSSTFKNSCPSCGSFGSVRPFSVTV